MYIKSLVIKDVRGVANFSMKFPKGKEAGWHVLLGENGSGKSTILRSIAVGLLGPDEMLRMNPDWKDWLRVGSQTASIAINVSRQDAFDKKAGRGGTKGLDTTKAIQVRLAIRREGERYLLIDVLKEKKEKYSADNYFWSGAKGWFSCAFGPFRRFTGGNPEQEKQYYRNPRLAAHLTAFHEGVSLSESVLWLKDIQFKRLEKKDPQWEKIVKGLLHFINKPGLMPEGFRFEEITSEGPQFSDPNGARLHLYELSEGIKSILSLSFELIRLMLGVYDAGVVFKNLFDKNPGNDFIPVPGVVLIDEIDAHLHPSWQTRIGDWFVDNFPRVQFIVTTHSPLICRAAERGTIWHLPVKVSPLPAGEIIGVAKEKLINGSILDAVGTGLFGERAARSEKAGKLLEEYAVLETRYLVGNISATEQIRFEELKNKLPL